MTPASPAGEPPLARLFAIGYRLLIDRLHGRLRALGWTDVRPAFGFVLLAARDQPTTVTGLASLMGTTKQAASKLVETMVVSGYVERETGAPDGRQRPVHLTPRGKELLRAVEQIYAELEQEWAQVIGAPGLQRMRSDLGRILSDADDGALPRYALSGNALGQPNRGACGDGKAPAQVGGVLPGSGRVGQSDPRYGDLRGPAGLASPSDLPLMTSLPSASRRLISKGCGPVRGRVAHRASGLRRSQGYPAGYQWERWPESPTPAGPMEEAPGVAVPVAAAVKLLARRHVPPPGSAVPCCLCQADLGGQSG